MNSQKIADAYADKPLSGGNGAHTVDPSQANVAAGANTAPSKMSLLMASNDLDRAQIGFMVATGARAMNVDVNIFFALWGVNLLRRDKGQAGFDASSQEDKPGLMQKMMQMMMPRGPQRSGLSKMNFAGMGPVMMKHLMREKGTATLPELMEMSVDLGIEFIVCAQSMEIMGICRSDIVALPNLRFAGIATFIEQSVESKICFMI
jgi:peroxiredoxin family protein